MKIIEYNQNIALLFNKKKVFIQGANLPFIECVVQNGRNTIIHQLTDYQIKTVDNNHASIILSDGEYNCIVEINKIDNQLDIRYSANGDYVILYLFTDDNETVFYNDQVVSARIFTKSKKEKVASSSINVLGKQISLNRTEIVTKRHLPLKLKSSNGYFIQLNEEPQLIDGTDSLALVLHTSSAKGELSIVF